MLRRESTLSFLVKQDLKQGIEYEGLALETNGSGELAEALNQPGWDLQILDSDGAVVDVLQLKATDSAAYLRQTLEKYPDIQIMATEEVAALEEFDATLIDSGISNAEITADVTNAVYGSNPDFLDVFSPVLPLVFILATEGSAYRTRKRDRAAVCRAFLGKSEARRDGGLPWEQSLSHSDLEP